MPAHYLRTLVHRERSQKANRHLAGYLAFIAGAINAGGFLIVHQYTSHMSGIVSSMADGLVLGQSMAVVSGLSALISFVLGAGCAAVIINWGRRRQLRSKYALPLLLEAVLLVSFALLGEALGRGHWLFAPLMVALLCFIMGLQNAMVTKISNAEIRTTHITGMVTDIGIELGKLLYWNGSRAEFPVVANRSKLALLATLVFLFFVGGIVGAIGFKQLGVSSALVLAAMLTVLAAVPLSDDLGYRLRRLRRFLR